MTDDERHRGAKAEPGPEAALVLAFPKGLFGFEAVHRYALIEAPSHAPFKLLRALPQGPEFVVVDAVRLDPTYVPVLVKRDAKALRWPHGGDFSLLVILGLAGRHGLTANLKGPVVIDRARRLGRQVIVAGEEYSARRPVFQARPQRGDSI